MRNRTADSPLALSLSYRGGFVLTGASLSLLPHQNKLQAQSLEAFSNCRLQSWTISKSSKDSLFDRARGRMVGSDEYLTKPFTKESLLRAVETHLAHRTAA